MAGKRKEINNNKVFLRRFRTLINEDARSQDELAKEFGASRQTVSKWISGESIPNIDALVKMAKLYNVSTDYLLGVSDTMSADVSVKAAMEYTGLSEAAVERLHMGIGDLERGAYGLDARENLEVASALIQNGAFTSMIYHLNGISVAEYTEKILTTLYEQHIERDRANNHIRFVKKEDRDFVAANLIHVLAMKTPWRKDRIQENVKKMNDSSLVRSVKQALFSAEQTNELHQFHAAKAFNGYIDELVKLSEQRAQETLEKHKLLAVEIENNRS